jgi:hypothetical protein
VTDAGLAHLVGHATLKEIGLTGTAVTDAGVAHLKGVPKLAVLHLDDTAVTDAALRHLGGHPGLQYLNVGGTRVTERGVRTLHAADPTRQIIYSGGLLGSPDPDHTAANWIASLDGVSRGRAGPNDRVVLTTVNVSHKAFKDGELSYLRDLQGLERLYLNDTAVTDGGLVHLKQLKALTVLDLRGTAVTDGGLVHLTVLKGLKRLRVARTTITEQGVKEFQAAVPGCEVDRDGGDPNE